jgi:ATP-dependent protease ClpP protease subunit
LPTWSGILAEIQAEVAKGNPSAFDVVRRRYLAALTAHTNRNVILYATKWTQSGDHDPNLTSITEEDVQGLMEVVHGLPGKQLDLIMHSPGGSAEAAEALVHYLRAKFDHIRVIVPHAAMSAATLVACAANEIVMGKQSSLGPVDPQYILSDPSGRIQAVPAQAILDQFDLAKQECKDPHLLGAWAPMLGQYGPALLMQCKNALKLAENLAAEWIRTWMLEATKGKKGAIKARSIAKALRDHKRFRSHARHISRDQARAIGLVVTDLEADQNLQDIVLSVFHATTLTFDNTAAVKVIENQLGRAFVKIQRTVQIPLQMVPPPMVPQPTPVPSGPPSSPPQPPGVPETAVRLATRITLRVPQGPTTGLNAIIGRWPGEESDADIERALSELS